MDDEALTHSWDVDADEARTIQNRLRARVIQTDDLGPVNRLAGVDIGFEQDGGVTRAAVQVLSFPDLVPLESRLHRQPTTFPYIPGLLSFRELPAAIAALDALETQPDLILCDGHGYAHPRRFGIACHLGVIRDTPAIGVGKSLLVGRYDPVPDERGAWQPLHHRGETIGAVLRTRVGVQPIFVSVGHRISLATAIKYVLRCTTRYRLPETTRYAHRLASSKEGI